MKLEDLKRKLAKLRQRIDSINKKIDEGVDFEEEEKLETRKESIFESMSTIGKEIEALDQELDQQQSTGRVSDLVTIFREADDSLLRQAYEALSASWHTEIPSTMSLFGQSAESAHSASSAHSNEPDCCNEFNLITELDRLGNSLDGAYSGLEGFIAHLWQSADNLLLGQLGKWGQDHYPQVNWVELHRTMQNAVSERTQSLQPAIFIKLSPGEERTTQSVGNEPHYRLEAWLIEDIEAYKAKGKRRRGFKSLVKAETPEAEPFPIAALETKIQSLLLQWIKLTRQMEYEKDPEFYVFLPMELLDMAVDQWPLTSTGCLGHAYSVVLCCLDRIDYPTTSIRGWRRYWQRHEDSAEKVASKVFVKCDGSDISDVRMALRQIEDDGAVGLHLPDAPSAEMLALIAEELWMVGVPLMFWGRCDELGIDNTQELDKILQKKNLGELSETIKSERYLSRDVQCCIGHHLSLLRDNPLLIYPLSA